MITEKIKKHINNALSILSYPNVNFSVDKSKFINQGDINTNVALMLQKTPVGQGKNPMMIAQEIVDNMNAKDFLKVDIAKPGFINFYLNPDANFDLIKTINSEQENFPIFPQKDEIVSVEFVSANPTGYLHIGHARNAALGEALSKLYEKIGYKVIRDYIINNAGNQMNKLGSSTLVRYWQEFGKNVELPEDSYHGDEIILVAKALKKQYNDKFLNVTIDNNFLIENVEVRQIIKDFAEDYLMNQIKSDLLALGVTIDCYWSEKLFHQQYTQEDVVNMLPKKYVYKKDGALFLKTTEFGDDKDRVLIKSDGVPTYFFPDIFYHNWKIARDKKITKVIDIWGTDHYSYLVRMAAALKCMNYDTDKLFKVVFMQMVRLVKNGQEYKMSKRSGQSLTLMDLVNAIGKDQANWFLISVSASTHLEIDVDLALSHDANNPLYYVQYASARANSLIRKNNFKFDPNKAITNLNLDIEKELLNNFHFYKDTILYAINKDEPQKLTNYIYNICRLFHSYYEQVQIINPNDSSMTYERLALVNSFIIVLTNALKLINIQSKKEM